MATRHEQRHAPSGIFRPAALKPSGHDPLGGFTRTKRDADLPRFDAAPSIAFTAAKETDHRTDKFRKDAVRIALPSGPARTPIADDPDVEISTLNNWITAYRYNAVVLKQDFSLAQENDRLRRENRILSASSAETSAIARNVIWRSER